jgi:hypothetical protein
VSRSTTHPLPETRSLQLLTVTFALANWRHRTERDDGQNVVRTTDDDVIAQVEKTVREQLQSLVIDMYGMSEVLGIPALFLRTDLSPTASQDPDLSSQSATFQISSTFSSRVQARLISYQRKAVGSFSSCRSWIRCCVRKRQRWWLSGRNSSSTAAIHATRRSPQI